MKTTALIAMTLALGGLAFGGCSMEQPDSVTTLAQEQTLSCNSNSGINPMKAALAVAMATEIGRLDAVNDLAISNDTVVLTGGAKSKCRARGYGDCSNVDAILGLQDRVVNNYVSQNVFNATSFRQDLKASFDRQKNAENSLRMNNASRVPLPHELFQTTLSDYGACGIHYDFAVIGDKVENLAVRLEFFGGSQNPFIAFRSTSATISIDPTGTMNGSTSTKSGMCVDASVAYDLSLKGSCCTVSGRQGTFQPASWNRKMVYCAY